MRKIISKIAGTLLGLSLAIGVGVAVGNNKKTSSVHAVDYTDVHTLDTTGSLQTTNSTYGSTGTATTDGITWTFTGNGKINPWRLGGKTAQSGDQPFYTGTAISSGVDRIVVEFGALSGVTASSFKMSVHSTANDAENGTNAVEEHTGLSFGANVTATIDLNAQQSGKFYRFVPNLTISATSNKYLQLNKVTFKQAAATDVAATINGSSSVNVGTQWSPTSITEDVSGNTVTGATYAFAASGGAVISSSNTSTGAFTCSAAGTVTVSATKTGYTIASKTVTVNSLDPYINLSLTSSSSAYTGQTVNVTAEYGNGVTGLSWSVESGSVTGASGDNSGYSAKIAGSTGTLTIRATDTGSALYNEVSVSVTKTAFATSPVASASVAEGKTTSLSAVLNSGGSINWESDDTSVATVSGGVVTGVAEGTATITAISADDTSVTASCEVTVTEAPSEIEITYSSYSANLPASGYTTVDWSAGGISGKINSIKNTNGQMQMKAAQSFVYNTDAISGYITSITITKASGNDRKLTAWVGDSTIDANPETGGVSKSSNWTWTYDSSAHYTHFRIYADEGAFYASSIVIGYEKVAKVDPTGITLNDSTAISMDTYGYGRRTLEATVEPFNANDRTVIWGSNDSSVVTVDNGVLTAKGIGSTTIYAHTSNYDSESPVAALIKTVSVTVTEALYKKATFVPTSTSTLSQEDDYLSSGSASLSTTGSFNTDKSLNAIQLGESKSATFTISGYTGMKITGIDLIMSSNAGAGSGSLSVTAGSSTILSIATAGFDDASWNGAYEANPTDLFKSTTAHVVEDGEDIVLSFSSTVKSLYIHSVAVRYLDYSLEQWCGNFLNQITCDGGNPGSITDDSKWGDLGTAFAALDEDLRGIAANATADKTSDSVIEQAMARYDLILRKYGIGTSEGQHTDFIGRFGVGKVNGPLNATMVQPVTNSSSSTIIIVVVALTSISSIGVLLVIKRKRSLVK